MIIFISEPEISKDRQISIEKISGLPIEIEDEAKLKKKSVSDKFARDKEMHNKSKGKGVGKTSSTFLPGKSMKCVVYASYLYLILNLRFDI